MDIKDKFRLGHILFNYYFYLYEICELFIYIFNNNYLKKFKLFYLIMFFSN